MKLKKLICSTVAFVMTLSVCTAVMPLAPVAYAADTIVVLLDPSNASPFNNGEFEGWGTSMGWWGNRLGHSDNMAQQAAVDLYSEDGLSLDIVRYNVGGGDNPTHDHVTRSDSKLPCFAEPVYTGGKYKADGTNSKITNFKKDKNGDVEYTWNWDADHDQLNVLKRIKEQNDNVHIEGYTNSPPWFMTNSQCSSGGDDIAENLDPKNYDIFADFLVEVTKHMEEIGLPFDSYSPMNEPEVKSNYWRALSPKQEGNLVAPGEHQSGIIKALKNAYTKAGIDTLVAGLDETDIGYSISSFNALDDAAKKALDRLDTHTYGGSDRAGLKQVAVDAGKNLWMSEVDGNWNGFGLAGRIITDLNGMQASAWVLWDIVDFHKDSKVFQYPAGSGIFPEKDAAIDVTGTMWGMGMGNHDTEEIEWANKYYAFGQFTRYIVPGDTLIASSKNTLAAYNRTTGDIKIVVNNSSENDVPYVFDLSAFKTAGNTVTEIRSNNKTGAEAEHWAEIKNEATLSGKTLTTTAKAGTVTTYVVSGAKNFKDEYAVIKGGDGDLIIGDTVELSVETNVTDNTPTWSIDDKTVADIEGGTLTIKKPGTVTVTAAVSGDFEVTKTITIPLTISGKRSQMGVGDVVKLSANVTAGFEDISWSVDNTDIAEIDASTGNLTLKSAGIVTVTVDIAGEKATETFLISDYKLYGSASWNDASNAPSDSADYRKAADGDLNTYFDGLKNGFVMYDYGKPYKVSEIRLAARNGNGMADRTVGGTIQASNDAITWTDLYKITSAIPTGSYTTVTANELASNKAYRYYKYINPDEMTNIAEFQIVGTASDDIPEGDPTVHDIAEFTDNFEGKDNIFGATAGTPDKSGNMIYPSGLDRYENVFIPANSSAVSWVNKAVTLTSKDRFRMKFNTFNGRSDDGEDTFAIKDRDGREVASLEYTNGGSTLREIRIGGENVLHGTYTAQSRSAWTGNKSGAKGWLQSQTYQNNVGYVGDVEIIIDGTGAVTVNIAGGISGGITVNGVIDVSENPISIKSLAVDGSGADYDRAVSYDNFDGDIITYTEDLPAPSEPIVKPELPSDGTIISLDFDNSLESGSSYGKATALGEAKYETVDGRTALRFDNSNDTAIMLTDANGNSLLEEFDEFTVSFSYKQTSAATSWWFFAASDDNAQTYQNEHYLGVMGYDDTLKTERYNNNNAARDESANVSNTAVNGEWNDVIISVERGVTKLYINGALADIKPSDFRICDILGATSVVYLGRANWGTGEFATGYIDDFVIRKGTYAKSLEDIDLGDTSAVKDDISLASATGVTWTSSNTDIITTDGKVTRQCETTDVILTATDGNNTKEFTVTVIGYSAVADAFNAFVEDGEIKVTVDRDNGNPYAFAVVLCDNNGEVISLINAKNGVGSFGKVENGVYQVKFPLGDGMTPTHNTVIKTVEVK